MTVNRRKRLFLARLLNTAIYVVMAASALLVFFAGVTGLTGPWLLPAVILILGEVVVFAACGFRCPLTAVVARYADDAPVSDTFMPERLTRYTALVFGPIIAIGFLLLALRVVF